MRFSNTEQLIIQKAKELFPNSPVDQAYFVALVEQESGFNPAAHNQRSNEGGGEGLFQFGEDLRTRFGVGKDSDEASQIRAGSQYIQELHARHKGVWPEIAGEYNLGRPDYMKMKSGKTLPHIARFQKEYLPRLTARAQKREPSLANITLAGPLVPDKSLAEGDAEPPKTPLPYSPMAGGHGSPSPRTATAQSFMERLASMSDDDKKKAGQAFGTFILSALR